MLLLILTFIAGVLTVLAPCVLPLLPVIIGGSVMGDAKTQKSRPYIIAISLVVSLVLFTLLLKASTVLIGIDASVWRYISGGIIILLGAFILFPNMWDQIIGRLGWQAKSQEALSGSYKNKNKYIGPILIGASLGPVFASCSPTFAFVLATVLPSNFVVGLLYLTSYSAGLALVLMGIAVFGQKFIIRFKWASNPNGMFRRILGIIFLFVGIAIISGIDKQIETWLVINGPDWIVQFDQQLLNKANN